MPLSDFYPSMQGATPVEPAMPNAQPQIPNDQTQVSGYLRTTVPLPLQYSPDTLKQYNRPGLSSFRTSPIGPSGIPGINSAVNSTTTTSIHEFASVAAVGPNGAVQFANAGGLDGVSQFEWVNGINTLAITGAIQLIGNANATIFNAATGFQIAGAATAAQYLRGNGTNFVSAVLSGSDIAAGLVPIAFGGTGTATPALVQGNDITITGSWPDNTISVKTQVGVTAGSYTSTNLTVDAQGIITAVANGSGGGPTITSINLTAQGANISATNLLASATAGTYLVTIYLVVSRAATSSSTLPDSRIIYTDQDSGATITVPVTSGLTTNTLSTFAQATFILNAKSTTAIQYDVGQVTPFASVGGTSMQFAYHARAVFLN